MNQIPEKPTHRKRSPFYWWRRFPTHKALHHYVPLLDRIQNGDFDYAPYFEQAKWEDYWCKQDTDKILREARNIEDTVRERADIVKKYAKRRNLLIEDGFKTEKNALKKLQKNFQKCLGVLKKMFGILWSHLMVLLKKCIGPMPKAGVLKNPKVKMHKLLLIEF